MSRIHHLQHFNRKFNDIIVRFTYFDIVLRQKSVRHRTTGVCWFSAHGLTSNTKINMLLRCSINILWGTFMRPSWSVLCPAAGSSQCPQTGGIVPGYESSQTGRAKQRIPWTVQHLRHLFSPQMSTSLSPIQ